MHGVSLSNSVSDSQSDLREKQPRLVSLLTERTTDWPYTSRIQIKKSRWRFQKWRQIGNQKGKRSKLQALICNQLLFNLLHMWAEIYSIHRGAWWSSGSFKMMFNDIPQGSARKIIYVEAPHKLKRPIKCGVALSYPELLLNAHYVVTIVLAGRLEVRCSFFLSDTWIKINPLSKRLIL